MGRSRGAPYRNNNPSTNLRNKSPPMKKSKRKETTLENLNINFGPPATPNEKKTSNESTERFIFLEKAFDKAFQLEDSMPSPGILSVQSSLSIFTQKYLHKCKDTLKP